MTPNRRFLTSIALTTVAAVCISAMGCGDKGGGKGTTTVESTTKKVETTGSDKKPTADGVKTETKTDSEAWDKAENKKDGGKSAPPFPADKANGSEAGSSTVPGGGVETP